MTASPNESVTSFHYPDTHLAENSAKLISGLSNVRTSASDGPISHL